MDRSIKQMIDRIKELSPDIDLNETSGTSETAAPVPTPPANRGGLTVKWGQFVTDDDPKDAATTSDDH
ncbi:MAG: hypothetical protein ACKVVP_09640 [Chloroflexota bacterium]